ncbi:MAG: hypothetical protein FD177_872 [Desulfovibrionaceae bacterium]|nr:MAG: hypothetical protein FD177_872 [Desulfovibrionaceae bacterium]
MTRPLSPGETCDKSGQYRVEGPRGGDRGREITATKGNTMPPGQAPGERFVLVDPTKHKK